MYANLALVYDKFMADTPYDDWLALIERIWSKHNFDPTEKLILELGCGTGNMTLRLRSRGCDVIGLDSSPEMLTVAADKASDLLFLCQDMRDFELYGTVDGVICICDGINYLTKPSDVVKTFRLVKNYLNPGGIFIFDINTKYKYDKILDKNYFTAVCEDAAYIWDNFYDKQTKINEYSLCFFVKTEKDLYSRHEEIHYQRAYSVKSIKKMLELSGLTLAGIYDPDRIRASPDSQRLFFVACNYTDMR